MQKNNFGTARPIPQRDTGYYDCNQGQAADVNRTATFYGKEVGQLFFAIR